MVYNNILEAMGHTPMVRLNHMVPPDAAEILVKFEGLNVGGSIKTRTAFNMIRDAEMQGILQPEHWLSFNWRCPRIPYHYHYAGFGFRGTAQARAPLWR